MAFDGLLGYGEGSLFSVAVENVPPFDRLLGYGEGSLLSMAVENVPSSFHVPAIFKQIVLFIGY